MRKNKFNKLFKEEFQEKYAFNLTTKDIFKEGELKVTPTKHFNSTIYWKFSSICTTCLLIISLFIIGFLVKELNSENNPFICEFKTIYFTEESNILTESEMDEMVKICDGGFKKKEAKYLPIDNTLTMYVYKGVKYQKGGGNLKFENIYFYVFDFKNSDRNIILNVDNQEVIVNKENRFGILDILEEDETQEISFTLTYYNNSNKYTYK